MEGRVMKIARDRNGARGLDECGAMVSNAMDVHVETTAQPAVSLKAKHYLHTQR